MNQRTGSEKCPERRGAALLVVVIAVVVASMVAATLTQAALVQRRQVQYERNRLQALYLVESGIDRAVSRIRSSSDYTGEDWRPMVPGAGTEEAALVNIAVRRSDGADAVQVEVTAEFPAGDTHRARLYEKLSIPIAVPSTADAARSATSPENVVP